MRKRLTRTQIADVIAAGVPEGKGHLILWDTTIGLGLRLRPGGSATWVYVYRPKGAARKQASRTLTIGRYPDVSIEDARIAAAKYAGERAIGADPAKERSEARMRSRWTVSAALDRYEGELQRRNYKNLKTAMSSLRRGLSPLLAREVAELTRKNIVDRIAGLEAAGLPGAAGDLRKHARSFLERAVDWGFLAANPLAGLRRPRKTKSEKLDDEERGRALNDEEIVAVWVTAGSLGAFGGLVRLGLLTGMRRKELAELCWGDVHADRIILIAKQTKTGTRHEIPLTSLMRAVLASQPRGTGEIIFPSSRRIEPTPMSGWTQLVDRLVSASGVEMTLHDLRRTCRTLMSRCGIPKDDGELAIGHVQEALIRTYNKDIAWSARITAFEAVSKHVSALVGPVEPSRVVPMARVACH
jgi:integrase